MQRLFDLLAHPTSAFRLAVDICLFVLVLSVLVLLIRPVIGLTFVLTLLTALVLFSPRPDPRRQFLLCMIGLGLVFTALVEAVVLKGDISRMNTVFKFYLQVWVLWAVASAVALPTLAARLNFIPRPKSATKIERYQRRPAAGWALAWWSVFVLLLTGCFLYPLTATPVRARDRFENSTSRTIDGTAFMQTSVYYDDGRPVTLTWDRQAFDWLKQNVRGIPTILEANTPLYRWGSRVSIYTGLPTVIGWDWHQKQQRSVLPGQTIDRRIEDVRTIYNTMDVVLTKQLLNRYNVQYIYVGPLERLYYDGNGLSKFDQNTDLWSLVYQNEQVKIFQVH